MAEEQKNKNLNVAAPAATTTAPEMKTQAADGSQFQQAFNERKQAYENNITGALDKSFNTQNKGLQNAFQQNTAAQDAVGQGINENYGFAKENLGTQANRTQAGMDSWADARNLNYQPGSQQALSLGRARATAMGNLAQQQQMAMAENERQKQNLATSYNNQVQQAMAERDYKKVASLLDNFNNQNSWLDKNAEALAQFGNFTGYETLYGTPQADAMRQYWIGSNPELAYNTGVIDSARYKAITGKNPPDYVAPASEGWVGNLGERWWAGYGDSAHYHPGGGDGTYRITRG